MKKAKDCLARLGVRHRLSKLRQHTFSIFRMNPLAKRSRMGDVIRIKPSEGLVVAVAERNLHPLGRKDTEGGIVHQSAILRFRRG